MRTVEITLGGKAYTVQEMRTRDSRKWRESLEAPLRASASGLGTAWKGTATDVTELVPLVSQIAGQALASVDMALDKLCEYAPAVKSDRKRIEAESYDSEVIDAFWKVLGLAYPFGTLLKGVTGLIGLGRDALQTTPNSASQPGDSGTTS